MNWYIVYASLLLIIPYLLPLWPARRLEAESHLLVSYFLCLRALTECIFLVPSFIIEYGLDNSEALKINLYYVVFTNVVIAVILCLVIKYGVRQSRRNNHSIWLEGNVLFKERHLLMGAVMLLIIYIVLTDFVALRNSRLAYQDYRRGIGFVWAGFIFMASMWVAVRIINRASLMTTFVVYIMFCFLSGSKGMMFAAVFPFLANPRVSRAFRVKMIILFVPVAVVAFLSLFGQFSAGQGFLYRLNAYFDMFHQSARIFEDYLAGSFDFYFGKIYISSLWQFVPRAIYPDKPYAWGSAALVEHYYPGLAETGHTPSFGKFTTDFADFGYFGFLSAIFNFEFVATVFSLYVISANRIKNRRIYVISYAILIIPGFYFHLPLFVAVFMGYWLLKYRRGSVSRRVGMSQRVKLAHT